MYGGTALPGLFSLARLLRCVVLRERITLVHGHAAFRRGAGACCAPHSRVAPLTRASAPRRSALANEAVLHARTLGLKAVFTDHSLFGFADASSILTNKTLQFTLADACHTICVSHTSKQNTVLRADVAPERCAHFGRACPARVPAAR